MPETTTQSTVASYSVLSPQPAADTAVRAHMKSERRRVRGCDGFGEDALKSNIMLHIQRWNADLAMYVQRGFVYRAEQVHAEVGSAIRYEPGGV